MVGDPVVLVDVDGGVVELDDELVLEGSLVVLVELDWSTADVDGEFGSMVVVLSTIELDEESAGTVVVGFVSNESSDESDVVASEEVPDSDFEV